MRKTLMAAGFGLTLALGATSPALAASSGGAQVTNQSGCTDHIWISGISVPAVFCTTERFVYTVTQTPSGNRMIAGNLELDYTVTFTDGTGYSGVNRSHEQALLQRGAPQVNQAHFSESLTNNGQTCTWSVYIHYVNDSVQFDDQNFTCAPA